jgi:hypothetical protein
VGVLRKSFKNKQQRKNKMIENEVNGIHQYVRNEKRIPIGVLAAVEADGKVGIAAAMCNPKDKFDTKLGLLKAYSRAQANATKGVNRHLPYKLQNTSLVEQFKVRTEKFFKDKEVILAFE